MSKDIDFFRHPAAAREWQSQERAMRAARTGAQRSDDSRSRTYGQIDAALRVDDPAALPDDFAEQMAAEAGHIRRATSASDQRFENTLVKLLIVALAVAGLVMTVLQGDRWIGHHPVSWSLAGNPWLLALGACLLASQGAELVRRRLH